MIKERIAIGVDIGGTKIKTGIVTPHGQVIGQTCTIPTGGNDPREEIVNRIFKSISEVIRINKLNKEDIRGIGMGVTGPLDVKNGKILQCPNLPTMDFFPLKDAVQTEFGFPVDMNNDANAMILGEAIWGAGKGSDNVLGITLGTGLGCAVVLNKKVLMGATETAGEIWISPYKDGIIEDYVSGRGVCSIYKKLSGKEISAVEIAALAKQGDPIAQKTWDEFGEAVAFALSWSINLIDPEIVIIGGSIANSMELFFPSMKEKLQKYICPVPAQTLRIVKAELGDDAGFIGAAALVDPC
ncbi:MAG: ROK family protein [Bacteroidota bacterium]|nr:ROK family protein [Bacteroidota bacterium]